MGLLARLLTPAVVAALGLAASTFWLATELPREVRQSTEAHLLAQARLAAALVARPGPLPSPAGWVEEARRLGALTGARVTLVGADGTVLGDSALDLQALRTNETYRTRPEILAAIERGVGVAQRRSVAMGTDLLFVAVRTEVAEPAVVRLAVPTSQLQAPARLIRQLNLAALGVALLVAAILASLASRRASRRTRAILAETARHHAALSAGELLDDARDDLERVARAWESAVRAARERADEALRDRALLETVLSNMREGVVVVDATERVRWVNDAARKLLELRDPIVGRPFIESIRHPVLADLVRAALRGERTDLVELAAGPDPHRALAARAAPLHTDEAGWALLVAHDVTALKRAETARRDFLANISHEFRTPLTILRGYLEAILEEEPAGASTRRFLDIMQRQLDRLERLVRDLLRLARLDAGQERPELRSCSVAALFDELAAELDPAVKAKAQRIVQHVDPAAGTVVADPAKLHDALRNLLENAVTYSPQGSTITLAARRAGAAVEFTVADEGPGLPEHDLERVFERFYRVDPARSRDTGGTGLGLAIVKHLVALHGGAVQAANRPEGGALFTVRLPQPAGEHPA